jgi:hypothetical protein
MNDAGSDAAGVWFQVTPTTETLPVQAFLACAGDVAHRLGEFRLDSVDLHLPPLSAPVMDLMQDVGWFADHGEPQRVTMTPQPPEVLEWLRGFAQHAFGLETPTDATLPEWSPAAIGWLAAFLASGHAHRGHTAPLRLTVNNPRQSTVD